MEDYTYELARKRSNFQSHMLCRSNIGGKQTTLVVSPLSIGDKADPARLVFDGVEGEGVAVSIKLTLEHTLKS